MKPKSQSKKNKVEFTVMWFNGYYNVKRIILASDEDEAIEIAKKLYGGARGFSMGENPPSNCGRYGRVQAIEGDYMNIDTFNGGFPY